MTGLALALLVVLVLPSAQIELGAKTLQGLVGSYTDPGPGHYWKVTYESIGTSQDDVSNGDGTATHNSWAWQDYPDETTLAFYISPGGSGLDANVSGSITTTLTWIPANGQDATTDPPPACVIVEETASASATGGPNGGSGNQADDGLGDAQTGSSSSGTHYSVQDGSSGIITLASRSMIAKTSSYVLPVTQGNYAGASVTYMAVGKSITINPSGATQDSIGNYDILIGQGCTPSLAGVPTGFTVSDYQWSVTGTTFQTWSPTTPAVGGAPADPNASYYVSGPGQLNQPTAHWYWNEKAATETISCTATVTPPAGKGSPFTITPRRQIAVVEPTYTCDHHEGASYINPAGTTLKTAGLSTAYPHGETWTCQVQTPALFTGDGSCNFSQIASPGRSKTFSTGTISCSENGKTGLDTECPYPSPTYDPYTVGSGSHAGWPANNSQHQSGDSPGTSLSNAVLSISINKSFSTYLMYEPPGSDVQPVPLHQIGWSWSASGPQPATGWASTTGILAAPVTSTTSTRTYTHPAWTRIEDTSVGTGW